MYRHTTQQLLNRSLQPISRLERPTITLHHKTNLHALQAARPFFDANDAVARRIRNEIAPNREELYIETFGRLAPWSECLENDHLVDVRIRHHEHRTIKVQASALEHISGSGSGHSNPPNGVVPATSTANQTRILPAHETGLTTPLLDLTPFDTTASMIFLFWLFARRLPSLHSDCDLRRPHRAHEGPDRHLGAYVTERDKQEIYRIGLIEAWRLGAWLDARCFQNDVLWLLARLLEREEVQAVRSADPHYSSAIAWARRAYDATTTPSAEDGGSEASGSSGSCNLRDFAVDVAAKRVYDVGMNGMTLSLKDREDLGANAAFAADVFASLGGQIGTRGVGVQELARQYLVEKVGEKE